MSEPDNEPTQERDQFINMNKKLIILDIDECIVHASVDPINEQSNFDIKVDWCFVYKRPFVDEFLRFCSEHFNVAIWTSAGKIHAKMIVDELFPADYKIRIRLEQ